MSDLPPRGPQPVAPRTNQGIRGRWWPRADTRTGAILYAVIGGLIVYLLVDVLPHIHIHITWH